MCRHFDEGSLKAVEATQKVYKDECVYCFEPAAKLCLHCYQGFCQLHQPLHSLKKALLHTCFVDIHRTLIQDEGQCSPPRPAKLEIKAIKEPEYELEYTLECLQCTARFPTDLNNPIIQALHDHLTAKKAYELQSWEEGERQTCKHLETLAQVALPQQVGHKCHACSLDGNLWLCLVCGSVGCGRRQFDGSGGNGHGAEHFEQTRHCTSVKLGTITAEGDADVYCYVCDEMRKDPQLKDHLTVFRMDLFEFRKTEATVSELQLEQNLKFDFALADADGHCFEDSGLTGIINGGNFCYISSVCQLLVRSQILQLSSEHFERCPSNPVACVLCQTSKLVCGLSKSPKAISAWMFKAAVAGNHREFSTARQNDAAEFCQYFLESLQRKDPQLVSKSLEFTLSEGAVNYQSLILQLCVCEDDLDTLKLTTLLDRFFTGNSTIYLPSPYILMAVNRIVVKNWVPQKLDISLSCPRELDLSAHISAESMNDQGAGPFPWPEQLQTLQSMGFEEGTCQASLMDAKGNVEAAMNAILEGRYANLEVLTQAGFPALKAHAALVDSRGDVEKAMELLLQPQISAANQADRTKRCKYELVGFVSHRGPSMHCGHYVAHVSVANPADPTSRHWVLFNDEKAVIVPDDALDTSQAYIVLYKQTV